MSLAREAADLLEGRQELYGDLVSSWEEIGALVDRLVSEGDSPGARVAVTLIAMKLVRRKHSPENRDHIRDAIGYLEGLDQVTLAAAELDERLGEAFEAAFGRTPGVAVDGEAPRCVRGHVLGGGGECPRCPVGQG